MAALACHKSQIDPAHFEGMQARMRERYRKMSADSGFEFAESFHREEPWR